MERRGTVITDPIALALADRHTAQEANVAAATAPHRHYRDIVEAVLGELVAAGEPFTADDVHNRLPDNVQPHSPNVLPSVLGIWAARRLIVPCGEYRSRRRSRHASRNRIWIARTTATT